ncbi:MULTISPECIES: hypothetical protein [unclassified Sinorhizobium]|uniref:hypothetical protein n=1 Tax=unclassified Sinorhizobium TaxID=2613772 RepID=UPI0024C3E684|nr:MULTISPECIES: hypothetical protein [unclassified Sinorhizobium]MDK1375430.1 hypothetical protein [Sinorhizobium sp. 6-70]MDK1481751.1 hypothetical protein [Sinorhizobium sp. 6-117]
MHAEKVNEIVAHFLGLFGTATDEARIRHQYLQGSETWKPAPADAGGDTPLPQFKCSFELKDYDPDISYQPSGYRLEGLDIAGRTQFADDHSPDPVSLDDLTVNPRLFSTVAGPSGIAADHAATHHAGPQHAPIVEESPDQGSGQILQVNLLHDDDVLNMSGSPIEAGDTSGVIEKLAEYVAEATSASPLAQLSQIDSIDALSALAAHLKALAATARAEEPQTPDDPATPVDHTPVPSPGTVAPVDLPQDDRSTAVLAADDIEGVHVNGAPVEVLPELADFLPAGHSTTPPPAAGANDVDEAVQPNSNSGGTLEVEAGANTVGSFASIVSASAAASVTVVMGDYHQIDVISQSYVYADNDKVNGSFAEGAQEAVSQTIAMNIANFGHHNFEAPARDTADATDQLSTFPTSWRVDVVEGDLSIVHWIEQYNFVSDNDTVAITTSSVETTVLTGGNAAVSFASFLDFGTQHDLVIVGGHILDMNIISQVSVLYDNDQIQGISAGNGITLDEGGNLVWNTASIENIGDSERFESVPDYMHQTVDNIRDGTNDLPEALAHDQDFAGYTGLRVLYITGNLYDVNVIKQVSILGDADAVTYTAAKTPEGVDTEVTVHVGDNAVINVAQIIDYDSFGHTTYVGGELYSDTILIQSGIVDIGRDGDTLSFQPDGLVNEVIAFVGEDDPAPGVGEHAGDTANETSWCDNQWNDVMHTVLT